MAYNKSKHVETAQKLLNQGKVPQAIAEYQQILKHEPRDQVTLMTIGELYIRQGETFQAIDYFERLAQIFVGDGFLTKAIAVYKRIAKLAPEEIRPLEKLADLYVQQGVMSEARPLFLQLAEIHLKNNRQPEAVALLKKLLMAEPDNLRIQIRLADLYHAMGQNNEAVEAYVSASQRALARGEHAESEKLADKALKIDTHNIAAITVKARVYSSQGDLAHAVQALEKVPALEKGGEQTELLLDLYIKDAKWDEATALALRVFDADEKNFGAMQRVVEALLESGQGERALSMIDRTRIPMLDAGEHEAVGKLLNELATRLPGRIEPLEWLVDTYGRTSDSFRLPDALAQLGDALVAVKKFDRAKEVFSQLVDRQPESDSAKRKLNDLLRKMGVLPPEEAAEPEPPAQAQEVASVVELPKAAAPKIIPDMEVGAPEVAAKSAETSAGDPSIDEETQRFIAQSLTDVDLFASYGLTQKAIGLLEAVLRRAPRHTPTLEKLLDFVLGAGDDRRTAELAATLEEIHEERSDARSAERFGELRRRFQRAAGLSDDELAASVASLKGAAVPEVHAETAIAGETAVAEPAIPQAKVAATQSAHSTAEEVHEVDLSEEWASVSEGSEETSAPAEKTEAPAEFEIAEGSTEGGGASVEEFGISEGLAEPGEFQVPAEVPAEVELSAESGEGPAIDSDTVEVVSEEDETEAPGIEEHAPAGHAEISAHQTESESAAAEPEFEVEQEYELVLDAEPLVPAHEQRPPDIPVVSHASESEPVAQNAAKPAENGFASDKFLSELASEIDQLGIGELAPSYADSAQLAQETPAVANKDKHSAPVTESGPLKEVFDEFRAELGEMAGEEEDLETHYNLGTAFREMGLLDEAISEFQKVAKASENGRPFRYKMQCCTLLGLAFMEKGQPGIAAHWYDRALKTPGIEPESILALRYDLGVAQEAAGELDAALKSFSQVYAVNIDYRDVAERIAALQKPAR